MFVIFLSFATTMSPFRSAADLMWDLEGGPGGLRVKGTAQRSSCASNAAAAGNKNEEQKSDNPKEEGAGTPLACDPTGPPPRRDRVSCGRCMATVGYRLVPDGSDTSLTVGTPSVYIDIFSVSSCDDPES